MSVTLLQTSNETLPKQSTDGVMLCHALDADGNPAKMAAYGAVPVVQPTAGGYATFQTAGSTTALYVNSATTGGIGTTQYTVGDLVAALKNLGLIAS